MSGRTSWTSSIAVWALVSALLFAHTSPQDGSGWIRLIIAVIAATAAVVGGQLAGARFTSGDQETPLVNLSALPVIASGFVTVLLCWVFSMNPGLAAVGGSITATVVANLMRSAKE